MALIAFSIVKPWCSATTAAATFRALAPSGIGTVSNGPFRIGGGPGTDFGKFNGFKVFECADSG